MILFQSRGDRESFDIARDQAETAARRSGLSPAQASRAATANARLATGQERDRQAEREAIAAINRKRRESQNGGEA
ncbi:hypothetical protein H6G51_18230 [Limnothrix sp. FACHB-708]|uniref:hypothetical protein n=1 Tax=unclassified Limnothrix TaxID=2632864 RepID=UPI0016840A18|nr:MULTISPECIES: hypothetical protein [unclassified Limnothrix]MBD2555227.1 hypothetical protein [Limnothrix sp. FACHB-708]MBD2592642.1 hypothetical protein [Limnothrix sp. FACHB-406]